MEIYQICGMQQKQFWKFTAVNEYIMKPDLKWTT